MASTIESMNWIFTYQYELMYSFGAVFALFSMMSYVVPAVNSALERGDNSMDSSENFFDGFDGLDLSAIISDEKFENSEELNEVAVAAFSVVPDVVDHQVEEEPVVIEPVLVKEPVVEVTPAAEIFTKPEPRTEPVVEAPIEKIEEVHEVVSAASAEMEPTEIVSHVEVREVASHVEEEKEEVVVSAPVEIEKFEEDDDDEVIDYFSQSEMDVSGMSIEEDDEEEERYSAATYEAVQAVSEPVVDGFTKASVATTAPAFDPVQEDSLLVKPVQKEAVETVLKVAPQEMRKDLLVMRKREKLSVNNEEVLTLKKRKGDF